ncbi:hypothetical protein LOD99_8296 [Oopsacas minuta]|uniref:3CxxC-type domain-containing protein n=1 Tax=Oopsacas minuta TaxID=111878 RepID=A0AAV7JGH2_9METZ|nr:hypothetical protein LOD99_8296 [Oopsacas minuta]
MASKYPGRSRKKRKSKQQELIPIYYRIPGENEEIVSGYLVKEPLEDGIDPKRFFGHYQCKICRNKWTSGYSWQGYQLECKTCDLFEWPTKVYHLENKDDDFVMKKPHLSSLCEKCQDDGVHCLTGLALKPDTDKKRKTKLHNDDDYSHRNQFMIHFGKQLGLHKQEIKIEGQFIQELFDNLWDTLNKKDKSEFKEALKITAAKWQQRNREDLADICKDVLRQTR